MSKPIAVCISDIHFNLNTLPLASQALKAALSKAEDLQVPLVIAGDLHDTKAIIRAEVMNALLELIRDAKTKVYILVGNHDLINEKGKEHGLNYLSPYAKVIDYPTQLPFSDHTSLILIPYLSDTTNLKNYLDHNPYYPPIAVIMHQGFLGAQMGDYIQDKTSIDPALVKDFTVISGHYHRHQTIGTVTYIGSPFTMSFGEANDGPKGFLILNSDGTFTREILSLRRHIIKDFPSYDALAAEICAFGQLWASPTDLLWIKVRDSYSILQKIDRESISSFLEPGVTFKLDLIPTDSAPLEIPVENLSAAEVFDRLIDNTSESDEQKTKLKATWRELI